jgi:parvulin-like peptidyl-prolyl isomerase
MAKARHAAEMSACSRPTRSCRRSLPPFAISKSVRPAGPIKTSQGLHYVKLLDRKVEPAPTFEQAREPLKAALRARRAQELEQAYLAALDAKLKVAIDEIALTRLAQPAAGTVAAK